MIAETLSVVSTEEADLRAHSDLGWTPSRNVIARYYTHYVMKGVFGRDGEDQYVYQHSNGVCIIGVEQSHTLFQRKEDIASIIVDFSHSTSSSFQKRSQNLIDFPAPQGKRKAGAKAVEPNTVLCTIHITLNDATSNSYVLRACVKGALLEINTHLIETPQLLLESPNALGYIAIVKPKFGAEKSAVSHLVRLSSQ